MGLTSGTNVKYYNNQESSIFYRNVILIKLECTHNIRICGTYQQYLRARIVLMIFFGKFQVFILQNIDLLQSLLFECYCS